MHASLWLSMAFLPFITVLAVVLLLVCMESFHLYIRISPAQRLHRLLPALQQRILQRLDAQQLPFFDIALIWLTGLGVLGILLQLLCHYLLTQTVFALWLLIPAGIISTYATRLISHWLTQIQGSQMAFSHDTLLLGRLAIIYSGNAKSGSSAQALVRDQFGQMHDVAVEPEFGELNMHDEVILFSKKDKIYLAKQVTPED